MDVEFFLVIEKKVIENVICMEDREEFMDVRHKPMKYISKLIDSSTLTSPTAACIITV